MSRVAKMFNGEQWISANVTFKVYTIEIWMEYADGEAECEWFFESQKKRAYKYYEKLCRNPPKNVTRISYHHKGNITVCHQVD